MGVDEAGSGGEAPGVQDAVAGEAARPHGGDAVSLDPDLTLARRAARPVVEGGAANHQIQLGHAGTLIRSGGTVRFLSCAAASRARRPARTSSAPSSWPFEPLDVSPRYNIAPTQPLPVVVQRPDRVLTHVRWGLIPGWATDEKIGNRMINLRAETVASKFKEALELRRCLVAVDGFYEWRSEGAKEKKTPMHIHLRSGAPFAMAGLWERWRSPQGELVESGTIITVAPNAMMRGIHDRMPAILPPEVYAEWLDPRVRDAERLVKLLQPYGRDDLEAFAVSALVSSPANEGPELLVPQAPPPKRQLDLF